ncbi:hypothetical protein PybrP1_002330 [[Pythium] brassicae (nom. inval.)]|nr:hypothetical protein PybrP1_002330 [[Pythium] brassicae (nom. inval.)]
MASASMSSAGAVPHARRRTPMPPAAAFSAAPGATRDDGSKRKGDASYVFVRIKRRRNEEPVERLVLQQQADAREAHDAREDVAEDAGRKRKTSLLGAFAKLSTQEQSFVFTRIDTLEQHQLEHAGAAKWTERLKRKVKALKDEPRAPLRKSGVAPPLTKMVAQQQQDRLRERRKSDAQRSRGLSGAAPPTAAAAASAQAVEIKQQQTLELPGVRVVDLETVVRPPPSDSAVTAAISEAVGSTADSITVNGARLRPTRVLNPRERELDEAIWCAFRENDFSRFFQIFHSQPVESKLTPATFQRPADGGTVLMAAALHGRVDVIEVVLRSSAVSALQQDWEGATAASFAARSGFTNVEAALLACEAVEREKDFVYDMYCVDVTASKEHAISSGGADAGGQSGDESAPVVAVSAAVQRWLSQDANWKGEDGHVEEYMLESDAENNSDDDSASVDSNDENHADNDYPDEEESDDGSDYDSDDSERSEHHRRNLRQRAPSDEGATNDNVADY